MTFLLMVSSMVMIGKNLASIIHLLKDSQMLLSMESQFDPNLNQALLNVQDQYSSRPLLLALFPEQV